MISGYSGEQVVAHHLLRAGGKGMGVKECDSLVVPLRRFFHDALHKSGDEIGFFLMHGLSYEKVLLLANKLGYSSPDEKIKKAAATHK